MLNSNHTTDQSGAKLTLKPGRQKPNCFGGAHGNKSLANCGLSSVKKGNYICLAVSVQAGGFHRVKVHTLGKKIR